MPIIYEFENKILENLNTAENQINIFFWNSYADANFVQTENKQFHSYAIFELQKCTSVTTNPLSFFSTLNLNV